MTALGLGPQLDSLTQSCIIENVGDLRTVLESTNPLENLLRVERSSASYVVELLYKELQGAAIDDVYRKRCLKCLRGMGKRFHALPPSLFLNDITRSGDHPLTGGGFADIYKGQAGNLNVCLKVLRVHTAETERKKQKIIADFCQEALIWTQLRHPNVLSLLGVNTVLFSSGFCLVSPWMANGDIVSFLKEHPDHDKLQSICEIMAGLEYLHSFSPPIVHGDIKGDNILVSEDHRCVLADFGLATTSTETRSMKHTTSGVIRGSIRWMAPELYVGTDGASNDKKEDKTPRDTYAFACTVLEIMTGKPPFSNLTLDAAVIYQVSVRRIRPERPAEGWCPDHIWKLVELCWDEDPLKRPRAKALHSYLESLVLSGNSNPGEPGFIGYFNAINPPTCASAINGADTIDSDNPYGGRGQASDPRFSASLTPTTGLESRSNTPRTPGLPLPLHPKLPQTVNPNGIAKVEGIPAPRAPTASQYATEFFKLNERPIKDAVEHTGSYVVKLLDWGIHRPDQYIKGALEGLYIYSSILVTSLEVVARLHPVIGGERHLI
ncbi:kinase-like protein [Marasmius fiardii PR-910]|nr:kinase-like protein [Marasmius fiardii PR-910]